MPEKMEVTGTITHETSTPISVEVTRGQRGGYGWTIGVKGRDAISILQQIRYLDETLRNQYSSEVA